MKFERHPRFKKEFKKLLRKHPSLQDDTGTLEEFLSVSPRGHEGATSVDSRGNEPQIKEIPHVGSTDTIKAYKVRQFRCKSLGKGSRSGIRVTYVYDSTEECVTHIEIYSKSQKDNEDKKRIQEFIQNLNQNQPTPSL